MLRITMKLAVLSHPECLLHQNGAQHPERPQRVAAIEEALNSSSLEKDLAFIDAPLASDQQLQKVHAKAHLKYLALNQPTAGYYHIDADTSMNKDSLTAAKRAAGAAVKAVDLVLTGQYQKAFCNIRPPGHHAGFDTAEGFCFFNNVAVAAAHALTYPDIKRVAIIDFDVHHGNGTEEIFKSRFTDQVFLLSSFEYPLYPGTQPHDKYANIQHQAFQSGDSSEKLKDIFTKHWDAALQKIKPDLIIVSAGFDAHVADRLAGVKLNEADFYWLSKKIYEYAEKYSKGRVVSSLEGGYNIDALKASAVAHLQGMMGLPLDLKFLEETKKKE